MTEKAYKDIINDANTLYSNIRTIGHNGMTTKKCYYFGESVLHPKKNIKKVAIGSAPNPRGKKKGVDIKLTKKEYIERITHVDEFIRAKNRLPNFVDIKGTHVHPDIWNAYVGYLCKVQHDKGKLPSAQNIQSDIYKTKSKGKKYGHSTEYGCDNRGQNNGYYCGPHMVQEIIRNLTGKVIKQSTLAGVMGTTEDGSDHPGINTAFAWFNRKYGFNLKVEWKNFSDLGWSGIKKILESNNQDIGLHELYRDTWGHYTNYDKVYDNTVDVHNSLGDYCSSSCYCGYTENRSKGDAKRYLSGIDQKSVLVVTRQ